MRIAQIVEEIFHIYQTTGQAEYDGEPVSHLEHMAQAAQLAIEENFDDEVVLAAFLHDIGHIAALRSTESNMGGFGITHHEKAGAEFLRKRGFPEKICQLVEHHVSAKRYLVFADPAYYDSLSQASRETLKHQGGPMTAKEAEAFQCHPYFDLLIKMRRWDDQAKQKNGRMANLTELKHIMMQILKQGQLTRPGEEA